MAFHPDVERFLARGRELGEMLGRVHAAAFEDLRVRRAAPDEPNLMPEIDGYGALTDLWMEGIVGRYSPAQIEQLFMSALRECYEVLGERREAAARAAVPELDVELGVQ
ncbi:hypothetical protein [Mycobacterium kyorinense]|uniref:Uncharacterized protein n=1 Tax=Mycobacterium kyorinense TaxID=487514 RepID=A0A1X1Y1Y8_9MYCO|nr:hypothetical protein [Mycobacterium kyorinense]ORW05010.1 hypothetical protein AWC14_02065 [Mycobacterium kyorinense]